MIDLHLHSLYSEDGALAPAALVQRCAAAGIRVLSVTDHNCVRANAEAAAAAHRYGLAYIPGIEIDCRFEGHSLHVLGYGIAGESRDFAEIEENIRRQSEAASLAMLEATQELGFHVTENDMCKIAAGRYWETRWTGEMFAEVLLNKPEYRTHPLLRDYRPGGVRGDNPCANFYWDYYSHGKYGYYKMEYPTLQAAVDIIHQNHGVAVLAHPGVSLKGNEPLLEPICACGLDGIEVFSSYHTPAQREYYAQKAQTFGVLATGGSDFHADTQPQATLGATGGEAAAHVLLQRLQNTAYPAKGLCGCGEEPLVG